LIQTLIIYIYICLYDHPTGDKEVGGRGRWGSISRLEDEIRRVD